MGKITKKNGKEWRDELPTKLWAHRTAKSQATGASPFSLVYGTEAIILIDLVRLAEIPREDILEVIEEKHDNAASHNSLYQASMKAKLKKESFKWENLFGRQHLMYMVWQKHTRLDIIG